MIVNLTTGKGLKKRILFPDNQPHIQLETDPGFSWVDIVAPLTNSKRVLEMLMVNNATEQDGGKVGDLHIPYLMGARFDRVMEAGDSFDLKVIANLINSVGARRVFLYDPHSDVAAALINNCKVISNKELVDAYQIPESILIVPDAGATKKADNYLKWNKNIVDTVQCIKHRDVATGNIKLTVLNPEKCKDRNCVIIDDICDGGGTFVAIASQINPHYLTLIVTHGIFSKGYKHLDEKFDEIITSNSYDSMPPYDGQNLFNIINIV